MNGNPLTQVVEAILLAAGKPVKIEQMRELFDEHERPSEDELRSALDELGRGCAERAVELVEVASGWRMQIRPRHSDVVSRLWQERPARYSRALLETLALIAYRQPITRGEIEAIRGVAVSSSIMRTLQERNWIRIVGHREVPGRPELLGTTREFLDYFGLKKLDDLPTLAELRDLDDMKVQLELPSAGAEEQGSAEAAVESLQGSAVVIDGEQGSADEESGEAGEDSPEQDPGDEDSRPAPSLVAAPPQDLER
jgi:segregation and condensation protein B